MKLLQTLYQSIDRAASIADQRRVLITSITFTRRSRLGVSVSGSIPKNTEPRWVPVSLERGTRLTIHFYAFLNTMKCSHTLLLPFRSKLVWVSGSQEPRTRVCSPFSGTRNPCGFPGTQNPIRVPVPEKSRLHVFSLFVIQYVPSFQKQDLDI